MATALKHIEETLNLVKSYISTNLQTYLTAINVEKADGRTLTAPQATDYIISEIDAIPNFPFINLVPDVSDNIINGGTWDETDHRIIIKAHNVTKEGSTHDCAVRSYRFARAISEIVIDNRTLGDQVIGIKITNINYTPMMSDGNTFKQEIWVNAVVKHHGTFS